MAENESRKQGRQPGDIPRSVRQRTGSSCSSSEDSDTTLGDGPGRARIWFPIAGYLEHTLGGGGGYHEPIGLCYSTNKRYERDLPDLPDDKICDTSLIGTTCPTIGVAFFTACWIGTLCYQPCGCLVFHQFPWLGNCACSEQPVTKRFVEKYPHLVTKGPARMER